ncbi:MAG: PAS domain S-box protein, partial [Chloroflexota bacterium]
MPRRRLGRQVMSVLGTAMLIILVAFTAGATYFVYRTESISWQGRQGEAARNAAGAMAAVVHRAQDTLVVVSLLNTEIAKLHQEELDRLLKQNPTLEEVIRLDTEGHVLVDAHRDRPVLAQLITIPQSRWFLDARSGQSYLGPVQLSYGDQPYLLMAIPAPDGGAVAARVRLSVLWDAVADVRFGQAGRAYVVTRQGDIVAHTHPEVVLASTSISGRPELQALLTAPNAEWHGEYINFEGASVVGATAPVPGTDWVVITELPQAEAFAASRAALLMLGGGLLVLIAITMWVVARFIEHLVARPMTRLREGADRIGQGDLDHRIGLARQDEIGQLSKAFDEMADRLSKRNAQVSAQTSALQISEARYRAIVEDQTELICRFLPDGTLTFVNEAYCRYFGQTREALIGHSFMPLILAEDHPLVEAHLTQLGPENPLAMTEERVILPDGAIRWQRWTNRVILDAQGQVAEFQGVGQDITERKQMETALRESEKLYRLLA